MKAKVNPGNSGAEVLSIQRTRREGILLVLKKGRRAVNHAGQARPRGPVQAVQALRRCVDCGDPFNRGRRSELARARYAEGGMGEVPHP